MHSYNESGVALLRPLAPGERLWPELLDQAAQAQARAQEAAATAAARAAVSATPKAELPGVSTAASATDAGATASAQPNGVSPSSTQQGAQPSPAASQRSIMVVYGPPLSGVSTQARLLSKRYGVPVVTLDGLVQVGTL